jgi:hypothetical protein
MYNFPASIVPLVTRLNRKEEFRAKVNKNTDVLFRFFTKDESLNQLLPQTALDVVRYLWPFRKCVEPPFVAEFFLCDAPKKLPPKRKVLDENHINTGYSYPCESLVVYRKQEVLKVFIHETFHYLGLDKCVAEKIQLDMFTIPIEVSLREAYCEFWARVIQCDFLGGIQKERAHSVRNMVRVLRHMGLKYTDLWGPKGRTYAEKTNVFAYVVLTAILLHTHTAFVNACPRFVCNVDTLLRFVRANYRAPTFLRRVEKAENEPSETGAFRMSVVELNL